MLGLLVVIGVWLYVAPPWGNAPVPGPPVAPGGAPGLQAELPGTASNNPAAAQRAQSQPLVQPEPLKLAELKAVSEETQGGRDPFGFGIPPRPPAPPPPPIVQRATPTPAPPPPDPGPPPRPKIPVKFLGFAEDPNRPGKLVSLSVNGTVVVAREGDVVDGKYRLLKVGLTAIIMAYLDGQGQTNIPLTGG